MFEKYHFESDYQDHILACLMKDPAKFLCYTGVLHSTYFSGTPRIVTARVMFGYWKKWNRFPTWDVLEQEIQKSISRTGESKQQKTIDEYLAKVKDIDTGDIDQIVDEVVTFAKNRALWLAIEESYTSWQQGKVPEGGWEKRFADALKIGVNLDDLGFLIGPGQEHDIVSVIEQFTDKGHGIKLGAAFNLLDEVWKFKGGIGHWLVTILAPAKSLKTTFCCNLALNIAFGGEPVFYYACEMSQLDTALKTLHCLSDRSEEFLFQNPRGFTEAAIKAANELMGAPVLIKGYPSRSVSIANEIRAHCLASRQMLDLKPKAIFIDHGETVISSSTRKDISDHREQGLIYVEGTRLALEMGCPVFLPDRCNADGEKATVIGRGHYQGAHEKQGHVDVGISINSSDTERQAHQVRYFIFLNRHGEEGVHIRGMYNPKVMRMTMDERIAWNPEEDEDDKPGFKKKRPKAPANPERVMD